MALKERMRMWQRRQAVALLPAPPSPVPQPAIPLFQVLPPQKGPLFRVLPPRKAPLFQVLPPRVLLAG